MSRTCCGASAALLKSNVSLSGATDLEKKLDALLAQQKELEKALRAAQQREASSRAKELFASASNNVFSHLISP